MITLKNSVRVPASARIIVAVSNAAALLGIKDTYVSSGNDSMHGPESKHFSDEAVDFRTKTIADVATKEKLRKAVLARLGPDYQAILEDLGGENEHLHVEYDPRATRKR